MDLLMFDSVITLVTETYGRGAGAVTRWNLHLCAGAESDWSGNIAK